MGEALGECKCWTAGPIGATSGRCPPADGPTALATRGEGRQLGYPNAAVYSMGAAASLARRAGRTPACIRRCRVRGGGGLGYSKPQEANRVALH